VYDEDDVPDDPASVAPFDGSLPACGELGCGSPPEAAVPVTVCVACVVDTGDEGGGDTAVVTVEITVVTGAGAGAGGRDGVVIGGGGSDGVVIGGSGGGASSALAAAAQASAATATATVAIHGRLTRLARMRVSRTRTGLSWLRRPTSERTCADRTARFAGARQKGCKTAIP
jgi:hypothetical protein